MKMNRKSYIAYILSACFLITMVLCASPWAAGATTTTGSTTVKNIKTKVNLSASDAVAQEIPAGGVKAVEAKKYDQLAMPAKGEEIAVVRTKQGVIKIKLMVNYAPKAVEIFKNRVNSGYYNGLSFNKLIGNSIVQGGTNPQNAAITTNVSANFDLYNPELRNYRGAVSIASGDAGSIDQFVIVQAGPNKMTKDMLSYMKSAGEAQFTKQIINKYQRIGGAPWLDFHNVIFGQVFAGMDVIDKIAKSAVDEDNKLKKEVKITKITIEIYKK